MKPRYILLIVLLLSSTMLGQTFSLKGTIKDKATDDKLSYGNIRIAGSSTGTSANLEGRFEIKLKQGSYKIISSFIGYKSDTTQVYLKEEKEIIIALEPISIRMQEVTVLPGENPAVEVIKRAIEAKQEREKKLNSYVFNAYTKGLIKTTKDIVASDRGVGISFGEKDTGNLKITGIIENESKGYFQKPNKYKDEIIARKQSANTPPTINVLTGGRLLQNFYTNDIQFFNRPLPGPISDDALDYYYYILEDTLMMDNRSIFQISFEPIDKTDPGFVGKIFIVDSLFALAKIDVNLNSAANPGGIFSKVNVFQQFVPFDQNIYMPIDYRVFVEGNFMGLAKFGFELNSIFYDYKINKEIEEDRFDMAIIKVLPDADKKDSLYWSSIQSIPNTISEVNAYKRIDSLEAIPRNFWDHFSLLNTTLSITDNFSVTGPLSIYSFNKITGHALNAGAYLNNGLDKRLNSTIDFSYGFSDKQLQSDFSAAYRFGEYRTGSISLKAFSKLSSLFEESIYYNKFTSTLTSLIGKYDFRDYYYTKGFEFSVSEDVFPFLQLKAGLINRTDNNAFNNSNFSFFNKSKTYNVNRTIFETKISALTTGFVLDFRNFIEDGYFRRRTSQSNAYAVLRGDILLSSNSLLKSNLDFESYKLKLAGYVPTFKSARLFFEIEGIHTSGQLPFQMMHAIPGNIESAGKSFSFRTLRPGEIFGDNGIVFSAEHNFNDELFRFLKIPLIKDWQLILNTHINAAWLTISEKSKQILPHQFTEFKKPFCEVGFGIGQMLLPFSLEFTWRLNYRGKNNFVIGINSIIM